MPPSREKREVRHYNLPTHAGLRASIELVNWRVSPDGGSPFVKGELASSELYERTGYPALAEEGPSARRMGPFFLSALVALTQFSRRAPAVA